jgi:hypothetical protein
VIIRVVQSVERKVKAPVVIQNVVKFVQARFVRNGILLAWVETWAKNSTPGKFTEQALVKTHGAGGPLQVIPKIVDHLLQEIKDLIASVNSVHAGCIPWEL